MFRRHPLITYFLLAYALTWWVYPLLQFSPFIGLLGLFGPAAAAVIVAAMTDGRAGVKELLFRLVRWRVGLRWYAVALGLPALLAATALGLHLAFRPSVSVQLGALSIFDVVVFVLVAGEELGWRGYALPALLQRRSPLHASIVLGVLWGIWHLPTFVIPGTPQYGRPFAAFLVMTTAYSVLLSWAWLRSRGSILIATVFHGSINLSQGFFLGGVEPATQYWLLAGVYACAALVLIARLGPTFRRTPGARRPTDARQPVARTG
jgi:membrane protease YdiL (CAAX protease family)